jgi:hypothetical protein
MAMTEDLRRTAGAYMMASPIHIFDLDDSPEKLSRENIRS